MEESDCAIVPMKLPNKEAKASAEAAEGRVRTKENDVHHHTYPTQSGIRVSQGWAACAVGRRQGSRNGSPPYCTILRLIYYGKATTP